MAVSAVIRAWGPTDEVFVGWERRMEAAGCGSWNHRLRFEGFECSGSDCTSPTTAVAARWVGTRIGHDQPLAPSMSVYRNGSGPRELDFLLRKRYDEAAPFCGSTTTDYCALTSNSNATDDLDLAHESLNTNLSTASYNVEFTGGAGTNDCEYRGASYVRTASTTGRMRGCWTFNARTTGPTSLDEVHCIKETGTPGTYDAVDLLDNNSGAYVQEHAGLDLHDSDRIAVVRSNEGGNHFIRVRFLEDGTDPDVYLNDDTGLREGDFPDISVSSTEVYTVVWEEGASGSTDIYTAQCDSVADDCTDEANWTRSVVDSTGDNLRHPSIQTDGDRQFIVYMEDADSGVGQQNRVVYRTRCGTGAWSSKETVLTPATAAWDQVLIHGRQPTAADRQDNVFHVAFVEGNNYTNLNYTSNTDADVWWVSRTYSDCP